MTDEMSEVELANILLDIPLFSGLEATQISRLLQACKRLEVQPGSILCEPRTVDKRLLILIAGKLRLESAEGIKLTTMVPIRLIGEMGVITGQVRASRVIAEEASVVMELSETDLETLVEENPEMEHSMLVTLIKLLYERTHDMNDEIEALRQQVDLLRKRLGELAPDDPLLADA